jgi:hypothetical protein
MGENARRVVEQRYTWNRVAKLTEAAYLEYLDSGSSVVWESQDVRRK